MSGRVFLDSLGGLVPIADVDRAVRAYDEAVERILGLPGGSIEIVDAPGLHFWFG